ncbi:elongation factor P isoform X2 [Capsicum annuum]|uniref:elongation factor P isoform X2 n=1 Tax=Capsicum annuum TaxID=4072 RepID=UPI0007BF2F04|nr:elongation factor P isoform X2 [Capsicum annuum]
MGVVAKRLSRALWSAAFSSSACGSTISRALSTCIQSKNCPYNQSLFSSAWSATQRRGVKSRGSDLKPGNVIEKKGRIYQVVKAQHTTQGRGGAIIQVELRDVDSGSKSNERIRTDETVEKVFVTEKSFTYLYTDEETGNIVLMEPETYEQLDVPKHLFGECYVYLQDDMEVHVQLYDERAMSASIPKRVTCTVAESEIPMRASATPQYKKVLLDNGLTVQVPKHVVEGDRIIVNTTNHSYSLRGILLDTFILLNEKTSELLTIDKRGFALHLLFDK